MFVVFWSTMTFWILFHQFFDFFVTLTTNSFKFFIHNSMCDFTLMLIILMNVWNSSSTIFWIDSKIVFFFYLIFLIVFFVANDVICCDWNIEFKMRKFFLFVEISCEIVFQNLNRLWLQLIFRFEKRRQIMFDFNFRLRKVFEHSCNFV